MTKNAPGKVYKSAGCEDHWYNVWVKSNLFKGENSSDKPSFAILLPPAHETKNSLLSNALVFTAADIIIRRKKMQGFNTLYMPGLGLSGDEPNMAGPLGLSSDWERLRALSFHDFQKTVIEVFVQLYNEGYIYRGKREGEPFVSHHWFIKTAEINKPAIDVVEKKKIIFFPEIYEKEYLLWQSQGRDWCISSENPVGYLIPAYYCAACKHIMVSAGNPKICERCGAESIIQDKLGFDTYFLSAVWPLAILDWREQSMDFKHFYPSSLMVAAHNMIFRQAARMIMLGIHVCHDIPFREILISTRIWNRFAEEEKPGKAKTSNSETLQDIITEYGADTLRFALAALAVPRQDGILSKDRLKGFKAFINKVWNASRFVLGSIEESDGFSLENVNLDLDQITDADRWILNGLNNTVVKVNDLVDAYRLNKAANLISHFFRCEYCNWYLEFSKIDKDNFNTRKILKFTLFRLLQLMHPFIPFITEEINHKFNPGQNLFLVQTTFPVFSSDWAFPSEFAEVEILKKVIKEGRRTRTENRINPKSRIDFFLKTDSAKEKKILAKNMRYFDKMVGSAGTQMVNDFSYLPRGFKGSCPNWEILIPLTDDEQKVNVLADLAGEMANLDKRIMHLEEKLSGSDMGDIESKGLIPEIMVLKRNLRTSLNRRDKIRKTINNLS